MVAYEFRISSDLLAQALQCALRDPNSHVVLAVQRHESCAGQVEFVAQHLVENGNVAAKDCFALTMADIPLRGFIDREPGAMDAGYAGCLYFDRDGPAGYPIGLVCRGDGVDWIKRLVEVGARGIMSWPLNAIAPGLGLGAAADADALQANARRAAGPHRMAVIGVGALADGVASALARLGLARDAVAAGFTEAPEAIATADVVVACIAHDDAAMLAGLRELCGRRLRLLIEVSIDSQSQGGKSLRLQMRMPPAGEPRCAVVFPGASMLQPVLSALLAANALSITDLRLRR